MSVETAVGQLVREFRANGRIVIVGASLAGLRAVEALRRNGFTGSLTIIGDEGCEPYDRPRLSKQVLNGWVPAGNTKLPRLRQVDAQWRLGVAATGLDRFNGRVLLAGSSAPRWPPSAGSSTSRLRSPSGARRRWSARSAG